MEADRSAAPSSPWLSAATGIAIFLAVCGFFFAFDDPWTLRGDNRAALYPLNLAAFTSWLSGSVPEWSGGLWAGYPLLSDPTSGSLYWPNFLFFWLTPELHLRAYDLATAFHLALMAAGSVRLLQALGASTFAALFGGVLTLLAPTQQFFGSAILQSYATLAWWPWTFLAAELLSRSGARTVGWPMLIGWLALGSQALWYPEFALYSGTVACLWIVTRTGGLPIPQRALRAILLCAGALALAAPQLLPTALYLPSAIRETALPVEVAAMFGGFIGSPWTLIVPEETRLSLPQYIGGAALVLAAIALIRRQPRAVLLSALALLGFLLALGVRTPLYGWMHALPVFGLFRIPMKLFLLTELAIAWLAALGANELLRRGTLRWLGAAALVLMAAAVAERVAFDMHTLRDEANLPGRGEKSFASLHDRMLRSGLIEVASGMPGQPPPRILETIGLDDLPMMYGLEQLTGGPTPLQSSRSLELLGPHRGSLTVSLDHTSRASLDLWGVHYLLTENRACERRVKRDKLILLEKTETTCLFSNPSRPPRFSFMGTRREVSSWERMAALVKSNPGGPVPLLSFGIGTDLHTGVPQGKLEVVSYRPGAVHLSVDAKSPVMLLVRESLIDGWRAEVDGSEVPLYPASGLFFAVPVAAGVHEVRLSYHTPGFRAGLLVSAAWILGAGVVWLRRRRGRQTPARESP